MLTTLRKLMRSVWVGGMVIVSIFLAVAPGRVGAAFPAQASSGGLAVDGALLVLNAKPGDTYVHRMKVGAGEGAQPMDITVDAMGFGESLSGSFQPLAPEKDTSPYSARSFITNISNTQFHLEPGQWVPVDVTLQMPPDFSKNTRYALIYIHSQPVTSSQDNGIGNILAVSVPVIITPPDVDMNQTGKIAELKVNPVESGKPIEVLTTVLNTGNRHFKIQGSVNIADANGTLVARLPIPLTGTSIFPTFSRQVIASYSALDRPKGLVPGAYTADVQITREDGAVVDEQKTAFEITKPYNPFPEIDEKDLLIFTFQNQEPGTIDALTLAGLQIRFEGTGPVTGNLAIGRYRQEPSGSPRFSNDLGTGGAGATNLRFVAVKVAGFNQGTAHFTFRYTPNEIGGIDPSSLFLAYRDKNVWRKLDNISVQTGAQAVLGDLPVSTLERGVTIGLGGSQGAAQSTLGGGYIVWIVAGGVLLALAVGLGGGILFTRGRKVQPIK